MLLKIETKACKINPLNAKLANSPSPPLLVNCPLYIGFSWTPAPSPLPLKVGFSSDPPKN